MRSREAWWLALSSSVVVVSPLLFVLGLLVTRSESQYASAYWLDLSSKATVPVIFLGPGFAALAAWDAARWRRLSAASTRSWLELLARTSAYVAVATSVTFAVNLGLLYVQLPPEAGLPRLDVLGMAIWVTVAYASLGFCLGRFLPRLVAAPIAFGAVWLWVAYTPAVQPFWLRNVTGNLGTSCCSVDWDLVPFALAAPALVGGALALGVVAILAWPTRVVAWVAAVAVVTGGVATAARLMWSVDADPVRARVGATVCVQAVGTELCAFPEHRTRLLRGAEKLADTAARLRSIGLDVPRRLVEDGGESGGWYINLASPEPDDWPRVMAASPLVQFPPDCTNHNGGAWPAGRQEAAMEAWLLTVSGVPEREAAESAMARRTKLQRIRAWPLEEQVAWYEKTLHDMRSCDPPAS